MKIKVVMRILKKLTKVVMKIQKNQIKVVILTMTLINNELKKYIKGYSKSNSRVKFRKTNIIKNAKSQPLTRKDDPKMSKSTSMKKTESTMKTQKKV